MPEDGDLNREYYGEDIEPDPEIALEWARIPHFYMNFYVYQYATGFSAAIALSQRILKRAPPRCRITWASSPAAAPPTPCPC